jgi:hypothetical protein
MSDAPPAIPMQAEPLRRSTRVAMIALTIGSTLPCGTEVQHETWALGPSVSAALKDWVKAHPKLAAKVKSRRVVSGVAVEQTVEFSKPRLPRAGFRARR